jgi:peptidoglycan/xylan/chitin deacetylase (PgdA/CDA1 family)
VYQSDEVDPGQIALSRTRTMRAVLRRTAGAVGWRADRRLPWLRAYLTRGLTVFVFHEITASPSEFQIRTAGYTTPDALREQIEWIRQRFEIVAPTALKQLGGTGLPTNAALVTFDDAWAGVFRTGLPSLAALDVPAVCFLNMGTVTGAPDLGAVRLYERIYGGHRLLPHHVDARTAPGVVRAICAAYGDDRHFLEFQGPTAAPPDLCSVSPRVWFGSHLFHHWDLRFICNELFHDSLRANAEALGLYRNAIPAFATPYGGEAPASMRAIAHALGVRALFIARGRQNRRTNGDVLERLILEPEPSTRSDWWYAAHRRRLIGSLAS